MDILDTNGVYPFRRKVGGDREGDSDIELSIVMAVLKVEAHLLVPHFESITPNLRKNIEFVVVTAEGVEREDDLATLRNTAVQFRLIVSKPNGIYSAYQTGWQESFGRYITFVNPEDSQNYNAAVSHLLNHHGCDVSAFYGNTIVVDDTHESQWLVAGTSDSLTIDDMRMPAGHQAQLIAKEELARLGGFLQTTKVFRISAKLKFANDYQFYCRSITSGGNWCFTDQVQARQELGGASSQHWLRTTLEINTLTWKYGSKNMNQMLKILRSFLGAAKFHVPRQRIRNRK